MKTKASIILCLTAISAWLPSTALANTTLFWGGAVEGTHVDSDGDYINNAFTFQIGAFDAGFDPGVAPFSMWAANWNVFDTAVYDNESMYFDSTAIMDVTGRSNGLGADSSYDFRGSKMFIWIYDDNTIDPISALTVQWALVSGSSWTMPAVTSDNHALPLEFRLDNATQAWIGAVDADFDGPGAPVVGSLGTGSNQGPFDVQTHTLNVIPEPSVSLLGLLGLGGLLLRRNRKN